MPLTWDGTGATPRGWSRQFANVHKHPTLSRWAMLADGEILAALADARAARLSEAERTSIQDNCSTAAPLDGTWANATEDDP